MSLVTFFIGLVVGLILGAGFTLLYIQHKMKKQLGMFESEMEDMMNMTQEMEEAMSNPQEVEDIDIDEINEDTEN